MKRIGIPVLLLLLAACSDNDNNPAPVAPPEPAPAPPPPVSASFEVTAINLTTGQPLSPIAVIAHDASFRAFSVGEAASVGLEVLAEGGDNADFLDEIEGRGEASGSDPIGPGNRETITVELDSDSTADTQLTVMTMLVNTNDAFTGVNGMDVSAMAVGDRIVRDAIAYDAGTEANSEAAGSIPGPADGGEGFNAVRDDLADQVTMHGGVVTQDDGLRDSVLTQIHRFDNPVARFVITRTQ
ncbi:MAG: spondin domain-containing protein [Congregibacter sp.]